MQAINDGDAAAIGACLGAPHYLSGITAEASKALTERANTVREPRVAAQLKLFEHTSEKLVAAASVFMRSTDNMIGAQERTIRMLRNKRERLKTVIGAIAG
jgi:hypothetical protein